MPFAGLFYWLLFTACVPIHCWSYHHLVTGRGPFVSRPAVFATICRLLVLTEYSDNLHFISLICKRSSSSLNYTYPLSVSPCYSQRSPLNNSFCISSVLTVPKFLICRPLSHYFKHKGNVLFVTMSLILFIVLFNFLPINFNILLVLRLYLIDVILSFIICLLTI